MSSVEKFPRYTLANRIMFEEARDDEMVIHFVEERPSIPAGDNIFRHDSICMGTPVSDSLMILTSGDYKSSESGRGRLGSLELHNPITGQITAIHRMPAIARPKKLLYIGKGNFNDNSFYHIRANYPGSNHESRYAPDGLLQPENKRKFLEDFKKRPTYFVHGRHAVLVTAEILADVGILLCYTTGDYVEDSDILELHSELVVQIERYDLLENIT